MRHDRRVTGAETSCGAAGEPEFLLARHHRGYRAVQERHVDALAFAGTLASKKRCRNSKGRQVHCWKVAYGRCAFHRRAVGITRDVHFPPLAPPVPAHCLLLSFPPPPPRTPPPPPHS